VGCAQLEQVVGGADQGPLRLGVARGRWTGSSATPSYAVSPPARHPSNVSQRFERLVKAAGVPRIPLHGLRHTHATLALRAGVHPKVVSERLGHSDIGVTLDTYSHAVPALQEAAAEQVAALVFGAG
jgi:integrase